MAVTRRPDPMKPEWHRHTYRRAHLSAAVVPCDVCGVPAPRLTVWRLRAQLRALKAANRIVRLGGGS